MVKVSVIIAAYNIEDYISKCLHSVINQTFHDIEIIIVNDGSSDNTPIIIQKYANTDSRVKMINKKNGGLIEARKSGFTIAQGEYVLFIDGDDWLHLNAIEILYTKAKEKNYDIVNYGFYWAYEDNKLIESRPTGDNQSEGNEYLKRCLLNKVYPNIWSKFIKKSFIDKNNISFPSNVTYGEDLALTCSLAMNIPVTCTIENHLYYYFQRETSVTKVLSAKLFDILKVTKFIEEELIKKNLKEDLSEEFDYFIFLHNYFYRFSIISDITNEYSINLYNSWKDFKISIHKNRYFRELFKKSSKYQLGLMLLININYSFLKPYNLYRNLIKNREG